MPEYTIIIETPEGTTTDEGVLRRFHEAILESSELRRPSALLEHERGVISSRFQVEAGTLAEAQDVAIRVFVDALWLAGLNGDGLWRIVEADEEPGSARRSLKGGAGRVLAKHGEESRVAPCTTSWQGSASCWASARRRSRARSLEAHAQRRSPTRGRR